MSPSQPVPLILHQKKWPGRSARRGGALFPVLIISLILFMLGAMLPRVLIQASSALRNDRTRTLLLTAAESGIAMAEARLKREITDDLLANTTSKTPHWVVKPSFDNPDFGPDHDSTFAVVLNKVNPFDTTELPGGVVQYRYDYRLDAHGWIKPSHAMRIEVNGLITVTVREFSGNSIAKVRSFLSNSVQAINTERQDPLSGPDKVKPKS